MSWLDRLRQIVGADLRVNLRGGVPEFPEQASLPRKEPGNPALVSDPDAQALKITHSFSKANVPVPSGGVDKALYEGLKEVDAIREEQPRRQP